MSIRKRIAGLSGGRHADAQGRPAQARRIERLEERLEHVEALVEGLQDAVHRDSVRHEKRMSEVERKTEPDVLAKALSDDARDRGL